MQEGFQTGVEVGRAVECWDDDRKTGLRTEFLHGLTMSDSWG